MKTKIYEFDPVIYPFPLLVCKYVPGVTCDEIAERFNAVMDQRTLQVLDPDVIRAYPALRAKTIFLASKSDDKMYHMVILYQPKKIRWGVVAHEALHVVTMLCDFLGMKPPTASNDEPHAYLEGWCANCIGSVIDGHPEYMKGNLFIFKEDETEKNSTDAGGQD